MAICGACRCDELTYLRLENIQDKNDILVITIPDTKTHIARTFIVTNDKINGNNVIDIYRKYFALRSAKTTHSRFFVNYIKGMCTVQAVGKNTFSKIPSKIAEYLKLPEPSSYTGHSFRRTSASLLVEAGGDIISLKRHGGWKSSAVAEGYLEDSISQKCNVAQQIITGGKKSQSVSTCEYINKDKQIIIEGCESLSTITSENQDIDINTTTLSCSSKSSIAISFNNLTNCTINVHNDK